MEITALAVDVERKEVNTYKTKRIRKRRAHFTTPVKSNSKLKSLLNYEREIPLEVKFSILGERKS